ncbi:regulator of G-protein signaling [Acrasis kona]|uniref:Regulator of G-protein signaling n=1 Tax=Acrasis kona TaxID=1008807 RepID=A0AAW2Z949_9EUKA
MLVSWLVTRSPEDVEQEISYENPLYSCTSVIPPAPHFIFQEEEYSETFVNPLFTGDVVPSYLHQIFPNILDSIIFIAKGVSDSSTDCQSHMYQNESVIGATIVKYIVELSDGHFSWNDGLLFVENYVRRYLTPVPYHFSTSENFLPKQYYRFILEGKPRYYDDKVTNIIPRYYINDEGDLSVRVEKILNELERIMGEVCTKYLNKLNHCIDYESLADSDLFVDMVRCSGSLHYIDFYDVPTAKRKCFYINLYNVISIQGVIVKKVTTKVKLTPNEFTKRDLHYVGSHRISLKDVENMLLGLPDLLGHGHKYRLRQYCLQPEEVDRRVLFALCDGFKSSALPHLITNSNLEKDLHSASLNYINKFVTINLEKKCIKMSTLFSRYRYLFSKSVQGLITYIRSNLMDEARDQLDQLIGTDPDQSPTFRLKYRDVLEKRTFGRKKRVTKGNYQEIDPIVFEEHPCLTYKNVVSNKFFRGYFEEFCKAEYSMENVLFLNHIFEFRKLNNPIDRREMAEQIYRNFLSPDAMYEINVLESSIAEVERILFQRIQANRFKNVFDNRKVDYNELTIGQTRKRSDSRMSSIRELFTSPLSINSKHNISLDQIKKTNSESMSNRITISNRTHADVSSKRSSKRLSRITNITTIVLDPQYSDQIKALQSIITNYESNTNASNKDLNPPSPLLAYLEVRRNLFDVIEQEVEVCLADVFFRFTSSDEYKKMIDEARLSLLPDEDESATWIVNSLKSKM